MLAELDAARDLNDAVNLLEAARKVAEQCREASCPAGVTLAGAEAAVQAAAAPVASAVAADAAATGGSSGGGDSGGGGGGGGGATIIIVVVVIVVVVLVLLAVLLYCRFHGDDTSFDAPARKSRASQQRMSMSTIRRSPEVDPPEASPFL